MKNIPNITESELEIMKVLWEKSPLLASEIIALLPEEMNWSDQTVKTFLNRLLKKQAITHKNPEGVISTIRQYLVMNTSKQKTKPFCTGYMMVLWACFFQSF